MKRKQSILIIFYFAFSAVIILLIIFGLVFGRIVEKDIEHRLAENFKNEQAVIAEQTAIELKKQVDTVRQKLELMTRIDAIQSTNNKICNSEIDTIYSTIGLSIGNLGRLNEQGIFYCSFNKKLIGVPGENLGSYVTDIFKDPLHAPVMSRMILPPGSDSYLLAVHVPVYGREKQFLGTLGGAISVNKLSSDYLSKITFARSGFVTVFDDNGDIIYNKDASLIGKNRRSGEVQKRTNYNNDLNNIFDNAVAGKPGEVRYVVGSEERIAVVRSVEVIPGRRWIVYGIIPASEIRNSSNALGVSNSVLTISLAYNAAILITAIALFIFVRSRIFKPIKELSLAANNIRSGDLDIKIKHFRHDELGYLAQAFNLMAERLKEYYAGLENTVNVQTREIKKVLAISESKNEELENTKKAVLNILEDLEDEKNKLSEISQKDEAILSSIGDCIIVTDEYGRITRVNPETEQVLGYSESELLGKGIVSAIPTKTVDGKIVPPEERAVFEALSTGKTVHARYQLIKKDKSPIIADFTATPYLINKKPAGVIDVFRDISEQAAIDKSKTEFVSLASHQLRTPLSTINWYLEMVLGGDAGKITPEQSKYLTEVHAANQRMVTLVNSLLNVSRIDLGTFAIEPEPVKINEIVDNVISELQGPIHNKKHKVSINVSEQLKPYNADPKLTHIIFQNLISNAVKYTPDKGQIKVNVTGNKKDLVIEVSDNGYGIPKNQQNKIFSKLFRADNVISKDTDGTGLGLYMLKAIVTEAGGEIKFESRENKGTTFTIKLPITGMKSREGTKGLTNVAV